MNIFKRFLEILFYGKQVERSNTLNLEIESLVLAPKSKEEIAAEYGVCPKTLNKRIKEANLKVPPGTVFPKVQKKIYNVLGLPPYIKKIKDDLI